MVLWMKYGKRACVKLRRGEERKQQPQDREEGQPFFRGYSAASIYDVWSILRGQFLSSKERIEVEVSTDSLLRPEAVQIEQSLATLLTLGPLRTVPRSSVEPARRMSDAEFHWLCMMASDAIVPFTFLCRPEVVALLAPVAKAVCRPTSSSWARDFSRRRNTPPYDYTFASPRIWL